MAWRRCKPGRKRRFRQLAATQRAVLEYLENRFLYSTSVKSILPSKILNTGVIAAPSVASSGTTVSNSSLKTPITQLSDSSIPTVLITGPTFVITDYGAVGDGKTNDTTAIQNCINTASATAVNEANSHSALVGAVVEVPAGTFESSSLTVPSNIDLQINTGGTLQMLQYGTYNTASPNTPFISLSNVSNTEITGSGDIDGQGAAWWAAFNANSGVTRPYLVKFNKASTILVQGITLSNGPTEHLVIDASTNVIVNGITISAPSTSPNTDGIDPSGSNMLIENCTISDGDDDIVMKPQSTFCSNITVTNCTINSGHGVSIGGETNDGLNGMYISNLTFNGTTSGIRLKAARGQGGTVQNVVVNDITMTNVEYPININSYYLDGTIPSSSETTDTVHTLTSTTPLWENISFSNFTSTDSASNSYCGVIWGLPELPVLGVSFSNVQISAHYGMDLNHVRGITFDPLCTLTAASGADEIETNSGGIPLDAIVTAAGWTDQDVGSPASAGTSLFNPDNSNWTINGSGTGIGGTLDKFNLASTVLSGNGAISAKVSSQTNTNVGAQAGVMIRESNAANAAFADAVVTPSSGIVFEWRSADGGGTQSVTIAGKVTPQYLQVVRVGSSFSASYSSNGTSWIPIVSETITMNNMALEGLAVTANASSGVSTAVFASVNTYNGPTVITPAAASPNPVTGTTTQLSATGFSSQGLGLTYNWSAPTVPNGVATPTFSLNGTTAAATTTATFYGAGAYTFMVTITDSDGLSITSSVNVTVQQTVTNITVSPPSPTLPTNSTEQFAAAATDQFGNPIASPTFTWSVTGADNSIDQTGLLSIGSAQGNFIVTAAIGSVQGTAAVTALSAPTITSFTINDGNAQRAMIDSLTLVFSEPVTLADDAINLTGQATAGGDYVPFDFTLTNPGGDMQTYVLTFTDPSYEAGSLPDGLYNLTVTAAGVQDAAGNTLAGGDQTFNFYRLYGDFYGTGSANFNDLLIIGQYLNQSIPDGDWYWAVDGVSHVEFNDLAALGQNLNKSTSAL
jgi:polygalacturonase